MIIARIPKILSRTIRSLTWELPGEEKTVYLTFDDGPTPGVTEWVLDQLDSYKASATFFCLGKNVHENPLLFQEILSRGHSVGNHSYSHLKGFRTSPSGYVSDVRKAREIIDSDLFRPPYGRILSGQIRMLKKDFRIIMWTVLSIDYNSKISGDTVVKNVTHNVRKGSIIVFHDSVKASKHLYYALPEVLDYLTGEGYTIKSIPMT